VEFFKSSILLVAYRRRRVALRPFRVLRPLRVFGILTGAKNKRLLLFAFLTTGLLNESGAGLSLSSCDRRSHGLWRNADISNYVTYYK